MNFSTEAEGPNRTPDYQFIAGFEPVNFVNGGGGARISTTDTNLLRAGYRRRARPQDGAAESTPPNTRNLDRTFRKTPTSTGPLLYRESSINQPRGHRVICRSSKYLEAHVASYRGIHTLDGARTGRAVSVLEPCVTRADGYRGLSVQMYIYSSNGHFNHPTRTVLNH